VDADADDDVSVDDDADATTMYRWIPMPMIYAFDLSSVGRFLRR